MTAKDSAAFFLNLSAQIQAYLDSAGKPMEAGILIRDFCKKNQDVKVADAEVALSLLLNKGLVVTDPQMMLELEAA